MTYQGLHDVEPMIQSLSLSAQMKLIPLQGLHPQKPSVSPPTSLIQAAPSKETNVHLLAQRTRLIDDLAELDDNFLLSLGKDGAEARNILSALVRVFQGGLAIPVLFDLPTHGVGPIMHLLPILLPPPAPPIDAGNTQLTILSTKCARSGANASIVKISGELRTGDKLYNHREDLAEVVEKLYRVETNLKPFDRLGHGDIGLIVGFSVSKCGDILTRNASKADPKFIATPFLQKPYRTSIQLPNKDFSFALRRLRLEDPCLDVTTQGDGSAFLSSMTPELGEKAWQIFNEEAPLPTFPSPSPILLEAPRCPKGVLVNRDVDITENSFSLQFSFQLEAQSGINNQNDIVIEKPSLGVDTIDANVIDDIRRGISIALQSGPLLGYPIVGVKASITRMQLQGESLPDGLSGRISKMLSEILRSHSGLFAIHEPVMRLEVTTPKSFHSMVRMTLM